LRIRADAIIDSFAEYTAAVTLCFSVGRTTTPKNAHYFWGSESHGSLDASALPIQTASRSVQPFNRNSQTWPTDRQTHTDAQTDYATPSVAVTGFLCNACDAV